MGISNAHLDQRRRTYDVLAPRLAAVGDDYLAALVPETGLWRAHFHGNQSGVIDVDGVKVFVKKIALTGLERTAENEGCTANLFNLPMFYQYGVGSSTTWRIASITTSGCST